MPCISDAVHHLAMVNSFHSPPRGRTEEESWACLIFQTTLEPTSCILMSRDAYPQPVDNPWLPDLPAQIEMDRRIFPCFPFIFQRLFPRWRDIAIPILSFRIDIWRNWNILSSDRNAINLILFFMDISTG